MLHLILGQPPLFNTISLLTTLCCTSPPHTIQSCQTDRLSSRSSTEPESNSSSFFLSPPLPLYFGPYVNNKTALRSVAQAGQPWCSLQSPHSAHQAILPLSPSQACKVHMTPPPPQQFPRQNSLLHTWVRYPDLCCKITTQTPQRCSSYPLPLPASSAFRPCRLAPLKPSQGVAPPLSLFPHSCQALAPRPLLLCHDHPLLSEGLLRDNTLSLPLAASFIWASLVSPTS